MWRVRAVPGPDRLSFRLGVGVGVAGVVVVGCCEAVSAPAEAGGVVSAVGVPSSAEETWESWVRFLTAKNVPTKTTAMAVAMTITAVSLFVGGSPPCGGDWCGWYGGGWAMTLLQIDGGGGDGVAGRGRQCDRRRIGDRSP